MGSIFFKGKVKEKGTEGSAAHILAHTVLGAAVAAAGGNDALTAGLVAGGAEAAAPVLSEFLYKKKASDLTAEVVGNLVALGSTVVGKAAEKAGAKIENNIYRDDAYGYSWSAGKIKDFNLNLASHWQKHKAEFPEFKSQNDYYRYITNFIKNPPKGTLSHTRPNGDRLLFDPKSNTFSSIDKHSSIRTVFRPEKGMDYWQRQIK